MIIHKFYMIMTLKMSYEKHVVDIFWVVKAGHSFGGVATPAFPAPPGLATAKRPGDACSTGKPMDEGVPATSEFSLMRCQDPGIRQSSPWGYDKS